MNPDWAYALQDLWNLLQKGGWILIPIVIAAQVGWFLILERYFTLRKMGSGYEKFQKEVENLNLDQFKKLQLEKDSIFVRIRSAVLAKKDLGEKAMVRQTQEVFEETFPRLQRHLNTIAVLASIAPLMGLVGTISGMVQTFQTITLYGAGNPAMIAGGISEALLTTEAGLVVAFPLVLCHNFLLNKADEIENNSIGSATRLINALSGGEK